MSGLDAIDIHRSVKFGPENKLNLDILCIVVGLITRKHDMRVGASLMVPVVPNDVGRHGGRPASGTLSLRGRRCPAGTRVVSAEVLHN